MVSLTPSVVPSTNAFSHAFYLSLPSNTRRAESTNSRVLYFSVFSMMCLVALAAWQVFYLKKYFQTKKLI